MVNLFQGKTTDQVDIPYSKTFAFFAFLIMVGIISFLTFIVLTDNPIKWKGNGLFYLGIMDTICFLLTIYLTIKYLIPSIKRQTALHIDNNFIIDNIRHNKISWANVKEIRSGSFKSSNYIAIILKDTSKLSSPTKNIFKKILFANNRFFYGTPILIPTQFLEGNCDEILNQFLPFIERQKLLAT